MWWNQIFSYSLWHILKIPKYLIIYVFFLGIINVLNSVRVSNEIGSGNSKGAKFATMIVVLTSLTIGIILFFVFLFLREKVSYIFTSSKAVAAQVADLSPLLAFSILLNSVQPVLSGMHFFSFLIFLYFYLIAFTMRHSINGMFVRSHFPMMSIC